MSLTESTRASADPADHFLEGPLQREPLRRAITAAHRLPESQVLPPLLVLAQESHEQCRDAQQLAQELAQSLRQQRRVGGRAGVVQGLLQEYALSSGEGVALMCLAEALLRIPDAATRNALIRDKISAGNWYPHLGSSPSLFVNAATWGLLLTGKLVSTHSDAGLTQTLGTLIRKGGEPLIRKGVDMAMRMMGEQFVTGQTIEQALLHARTLEAQGFTYSYDMLGEAALTEDDAQRYLASYQNAIHAIGQASQGRGVIDGPGISIKLTALHPRLVRAQYHRVMDELYPRLLQLALLARQYGLGLNIDAEETERLDITLDLLERLCLEPELTGFDGIGFVVQAYQKRSLAVVNYLIDLARRSGHRLMVRLVKGAYWDSEIKRTQVEGLSDYPVFTRKAHTDVSYLACARTLLAAPDAVYPQFATHNAQTLAAVHVMANPQRYQSGQYEFQCLHGMGEPLYEQVVGDPAEGKLGRACRIYAPVGTHETLLAYLVRRLLENGANTSFVNRVADPTVALETLVQDPVLTVQSMTQSEGQAGLPHPGIPLPQHLYGSARRNAQGLDLSCETSLKTLADALQRSRATLWQAAPLLARPEPLPLSSVQGGQDVCNPADSRERVGSVQEASPADVDAALKAAQQFAPEWAACDCAERAQLLLRGAEQLQEHLLPLTALLIREAGKTSANAVSEVREAIDFLRYYAAQVRDGFANKTHVPLGPVVCISPWNFPLAIFLGQVSAALAAGNTVLAKPAEQTPLIAAYAVRLLWQAGLPRAALQLLPGRGEVVGAQLVGDARVQGVLFTGSTEVAKLLQRELAMRLGNTGRPVPLVAETGGQNAMVVDSSALVEQVVNDAISSAFDSAGQRCSALRVLCVQEDVADRVITMLKGAMAQQRLGNPATLSVDIGPVIDADAQNNVKRHVAQMSQRGRPVFEQALVADQALSHGSFVRPTLIEIEHIQELQREVFGPVLHVLRYRRADLDALLHQINATGYGLTFGLHTRIDETIAHTLATVHAGNVYVNRNMVGAVVGVQPFGGEGLSGTGPKAGGPLLLYRLLKQAPADALKQCAAFVGMPANALSDPQLLQLQDWAQQRGDPVLAAACARYMEQARVISQCSLSGPTGESNRYSWHPRQTVLGLASNDADRLQQLAATLAVGSRAIWEASAASLRESLPPAVQERIALADHWNSEAVTFDAVLCHADTADSLATCAALARRAGPIINLQALPAGSGDIALGRLLVERSHSINTAAAGGNASLMTMG